MIRLGYVEEEFFSSYCPLSVTKRYLLISTFSHWRTSLSARQFPFQKAQNQHDRKPEQRPFDLHKTCKEYRKLCQYLSWELCRSRAQVSLGTSYQLHQPAGSETVVEKTVIKKDAQRNGIQSTKISQVLSVNILIHSKAGRASNLFIESIISFPNPSTGSCGWSLVQLIIILWINFLINKIEEATFFTAHIMFA